MGNHPHLLVVTSSPDQLKDFYAELQKKITDSIKALLGVRKLRLWEGRPVVARVATLDDTIEQIVYLYANPCRANLVQSIDDYPGFSSYQIFKSCHAAGVSASQEIRSRWLRVDDIPTLPHRVMKFMDDRLFTAQLQEQGVKQSYHVEPNAWMKAFGVEKDDEVQRINETILTSLKRREAEHARERAALGKSILGAKALRHQPIMRAHTPKPGQRKIFIICGDKERRIAFIQSFKQLCKDCYQCYLDTLAGLRVKWPAGVFRPPMGVYASAIDVY